jgi:tetratricopeptide (TPR) repeat protein
MRASNYRLGSALAVLLLAGCNAPDLGPNNKAAGTIDYFARGREHFARGHYGLALHAFQQARAKDGERVDLLNAIGAAYDRLARYDLAAKHYTQALELAPDSAETLNNLGYSLILQGRFDAAMAHLKRAREIGGGPKVEANIALAERLGQETAAKAGGPMAPRREEAANDLMPSAPKRTVWLERTTPGVVTLVSKPQAALALDLMMHNVDPKLAHVGPSVGVTPAPDPGPEASPPKAAPRDAVRTVALNLRPPRPERLYRSPKAGSLAIVGGNQTAEQAKSHLQSCGYGTITLQQNAAFAPAGTAIFFRPGYLSAAQALAQKFKGSIPLQASADQGVDLRLILGKDLADLEQAKPFDGWPFDEDVAG